WVDHFAYPFRWVYSVLNAAEYFREASLLDGTPPDPRMAEAIELIRAARQPDGTWLQAGRHPGLVWFEVDVPAGEPSRWLTLFGLGLRLRLPRVRVEEPQQLHRERQDQGRVLLGRNLDHGLQQPQLQRGRVALHRRGRLRQLVRRLQLAVGGNDPRPPLAFGLGLARHRAFHRLRKRDILDLDAVDVDAPVERGAVDHQLEALVQPFAVGEQVVEVALADDRPQRRLRHLADRGPVVLDVDRGGHRVDHLEVHDRVHPDRDIVVGDPVL